MNILLLLRMPLISRAYYFLSQFGAMIPEIKKAPDDELPGTVWLFAKSRLPYVVCSHGQRTDEFSKLHLPSLLASQAAL